MSSLNVRCEFIPRQLTVVGVTTKKTLGKLCKKKEETISARMDC